MARLFMLAITLFVVVPSLAGCFGAGTLSDQASSASFLLGTAVAAVETRSADHRASYDMASRPAGSLKQVAEAYLARYQPGPEPRVFESSFVYDRQGRLLAEFFDEGRRRWASLAEIAPGLLDAVIATEDAGFYGNEGVEWRRLLAALVRNATATGAQSGGSTITMQLARNLFLPPDQRFDRTVERKLTEVLLAQDLTRLLAKDEILELYLNLVYFGHRAYGIEAAATTYFGKSAAALTLSEATLLAGLLQQPARLDLFSNPAGAKTRQRVVLDLMVRRGYLTPEEADNVFAEPLTLAPDPDTTPSTAPHFLNYLTSYLGQLPGDYDLWRSGLTITTTLDLDLQTLAQQTVRENVDALRPVYNLNNAGLVALKPGTAELLAMVGSADFANAAIGGQVNVTLSERQPGSALKPVIYAAALNDNLVSPATVLWDLEVSYPISRTLDYKPRNYDERFRGPVTVRTALANSLNVPTVKMFDSLGAERFVATANRMGIKNLDEGDIERAGLSMALGGAEVSLLELTSAYHTLANEGRFVPPTAVLAIADAEGRPLPLPGAVEATQAISPAVAFLITDILSDNDARTPIFGANSRLKLSQPAAAKTGTTTAFRDNWTIGFTKYLVTGVWAGNNDNRPMARADGITGAGPIWNKFMEAVIADPALLQIISAPETQAGWEFVPPSAGVVQISDNCGPGLFCRVGGEYFTQEWITRTSGVGPTYDNSVTGVLAPVTLERAGGRRTTVGVCVLSTGAGSQSTTALAMPLGLGNLGPTAAPAASRGDSQEDAAANSVTPQTAPDAALRATTLLERLLDEQEAAQRWARRNGRLLSWGDCATVQDTVTVLLDDVTGIIVGNPLTPSDLAALAETISAESDEESGQAEIPAAGANGIVSPGAGTVVSGVQTIAGIANTPSFWKWQLDLLIGGSDPTFLALGERPAPTPTGLLAWNSALYPNGQHTLRLRVVRRDGNYEEHFVPVTIQN